MIDDFEREVSGMLHARAATIPEPHTATVDLIARARRRRTTKLATLAAVVAVAATGATAAVAGVVGRHGTARLVTSPEPSTSSSTSSTALPTRPAVATVACPVVYSLTPDTPLPAPSMAPRQPRAGDAAQLGRLASFAATTDPRFVVLGPIGSKCRATIAADGQNGIEVFDPGSRSGAPGIGIINDYLWHGGVGSPLACSVFGDPTVVQYMTQNFPQLLPCPRAGRTVTRVDAHVSTFVDADGTRGMGWMVLPSARGDDGLLSVLTCSPSSDLTAADCDTIIADYAARVDTSG